MGHKQELQRPPTDTQVNPQLTAAQPPLEGAGAEMKASPQMPPGVLQALPGQKNGGLSLIVCVGNICILVVHPGRI